MASRAREILGDGGNHPEERRVKTLARSLSVLDEWLERNKGRTEDEARSVPNPGRLRWAMVLRPRRSPASFP
jgi:hypothetical protein